MTEDLLFTQMNVVMFTLDREGKFMTLNPASEHLFKFSAGDLVGQPFTAVLDPFSHEKAALMLERTFTEGGVSDWELDHLQVGGLPVLLGYTTSVLRDQAGAIIGLAAIGLNLTHKLELTEKLAQVNQQLEGALLSLEKAHTELKMTQAQLVQSEKMRTLGQLVAGIAHEINNPSAFVANNLTQLAERVPRLQRLFEAYLPLKPLATAQQTDAIAAAEKAADLEFLWQDLGDITRESQEGIERIRKIILSLRNFSRLDEAELKDADLNEGLRSTLQLILPMCKGRIQIMEHYGTLPLIYCNPGELNQVFLNLLTNAVQAIAGDGFIEITSSLKNDRIVITIRDTGCGMDATMLSRLGEPFFTTKPVGSGMGLGLSISLSIIQKHHGSLHFESKINQGTSAIVELPVK